MLGLNFFKLRSPRLVPFGAVILLAALAGSASAHPFYPSTWGDCGASQGCVGWQQFHQGIPNTYVKVNGVQDSSDISTAFVQAGAYWNGAGTVASFSWNTIPQNFPFARITGYRQPYSDIAYAVTAKYDLRDPSPGYFVPCHPSSCLKSNQTFALPGYDLVEIVFYDNNMVPLSYNDKIKVARHELGHVAALLDHKNEPSYSGLMRDALDSMMTSTLTCAERNAVNQAHDRATVC